MKKISTLTWLCFAVVLFLAALPCPADNAPAIPKQQGNRFLFIVNTSSAMRTYADGVARNVVELMLSDMRGEFRQGDTIGLWLYNDKLDPGYPMQVWSKSDKDTIVSDMAAYLQGRPREKQAHLERVMPALHQVIKNSERITIILISDGTGSIQRTPFDKDIRALQKKYAHELRAAHVPFIIVLAARNGTVFDYTINYPGLIAIPHTADPEKPVETNAPIAAIVVPPVIAPPAPPRRPTLIVLSGKTNGVHAAAPPPVPVEAPVPTPPPPVAPVAPAPVIQPTIATVAPPAAPVVVPVSQPVVVAATPPPQVQPAPPPAVASQNPPPVIETPAPSAPPVNVTANDQPPPVAPPVAPKAPVAAVSPAGGASLALFITAFLLLTVAVALVVFLVRRSKGPPQPSLISQSIDRPR